jgi:hypothetical protein
MKRKLPPEYGVDGEFLVEGNWNNDVKPDTILDYNQPPATQPGLWCQWVPTEDKMSLEWDGGEKFYEGPKWMDYIIHRILVPKGYVCNGIIHAQGEEKNDSWDLVVEDNIVTAEGETMIGSKLAEVSDEDLPTLINEVVEKKNWEQDYELGKVLYKERLDKAKSVLI